MKDPFHDLHHQDGAPSHIRLISEGGGSHAGSPELLCIDSIQATHSCTTESQHTVYRSATACSLVTAPENALCCLAVENALELDRESIPEVLRHRLAQAGSRLSMDARLSARHPGRLWCIADQGRSYSIRRRAASLAVYLDA